MNLSTFFEDNSGGFSSIRLIAVIWIVIVAIVWVYTSFTVGYLADIPESAIILTIALISGKVIQRFGEKNED
jgi:hypothetical protein